MGLKGQKSHSQEMKVFGSRIMEGPARTFSKPFWQQSPAIFALFPMMMRIHFEEIKHIIAYWKIFDMNAIIIIFWQHFIFAIISIVFCTSLCHCDIFNLKSF